MTVSGHTRKRLADTLGSQFVSDEISDRLDVFTNVNDNLVLVDTAWEDLRVTLTSAFVPATGGPAYAQFKDDNDSSTGVFLPAFDDASDEQVYFTAQLPHSYKLGTDIKPHIHWTPAANGTSGQKVSWGLEYTWAEYGDDYGYTTIIYANDHTPADATLTAGTHYISAFDDISSSVDSVSSILVCRLFRDASGNGGTDDLAQDAFAISFDFHFQVEKLGSATEYA